MWVLQLENGNRLFQVKGADNKCPVVNKRREHLITRGWSLRKAALGVHLGSLVFSKYGSVGQALKEAKGKTNPSDIIQWGAQSSQNEERLGGDRVMNGLKKWRGTLSWPVSPFPYSSWLVWGKDFTECLSPLSIVTCVSQFCSSELGRQYKIATVGWCFLFVGGGQLSSGAKWGLQPGRQHFR